MFVCRASVGEPQGANSAGSAGYSVHGIPGPHAANVSSPPHFSLANHHHRTSQCHISFKGTRFCDYFITINFVYSEYFLREGNNI